MMDVHDGQMVKKNRLLYLTILSMIFVLPLSWRTSFFRTFGHITGYVIILLFFVRGITRRDLSVTRSIASLGGVVFFWILISVFDSIRFYSEYGVLSGENTFTAPLGSVFFHLYDFALLAAYIGLVRNRYNVEHTVKKALNTVVWVQIVFGILQLMIILDVPVVSTIYDGINVFGFFQSSSITRSISRIAMTGSEPASIGSSLGVLSVPYLLAQMQESDAAKEKRRCVLKLAILIVLSYFSKSSTVYAILAFSAAVFIFRSFREGRLSKRNTILWIVLIIVVGSALLLRSFAGSIHIGSNVFNEIRYYLFEKPTDTKNMSSMHRFSTTINDIVILGKHPLLGVGDGNQGFTYGQNVPQNMLINSKSKELAEGIGGVVNGGAWFWAVLSGYGIVGALALFLWFHNHYWNRVRKLRGGGFLYRLYVYALPAIVVSLLVGAMGPTIVFMLSIPLWQLGQEEESTV